MRTQKVVSMALEETTHLENRVQGVFKKDHPPAEKDHPSLF
jgi:hypothetical protein